MLDVADPCLDEAGRLGELDLAKAAFGPDGVDGPSQGVLIGRECRHGYLGDSSSGG